MKNKFFINSTLFLLCISNFSFGQSTNDLLKDVVTISNGKMIANDYTLVTLTDGTTMQIKTHAEAPESGVISRDNFVTTFVTTTVETIDELVKDEDAEIVNLDEIIGNADVEINIFMTRNGYQLEVKTDEGTDRHTYKWDESFK